MRKEKVKFNTWVVMGNDYPDAVFASEKEAEAHIKRKKREDKKKGTGRTIYWRAISFPLTYTAQVDTQEAQSIMREALERLCIECGLQHDWATFITISMVCVAATIAEVAPLDIVTERNKLIQHALSQFTTMLQDSFAERIAFEANKLNIN
jgi:DNA polymerase I-like protein with 3'-5' exonuclease and polymerase domains